jgi:hypothetical protein
MKMKQTFIPSVTLARFQVLNSHMQPPCTTVDTAKSSVDSVGVEPCLLMRNPTGLHLLPTIMLAHLGLLLPRKTRTLLVGLGGGGDFRFPLYLAYNWCAKCGLWPWRDIVSTFICEF